MFGIPSPVVFGVLMFLCFTITSANYRAVAFKKYWWVLLTDGLILMINFAVISKIADASSFPDMLGYTIGGSLGGVFGVWLSDHWKHE